MITGAAVISEYQEYSNKKRVDFILNNYYGIEEYIRCYEEILCDSIVSDRLVDRREENGDPGVAIQTSHRSDPTAMMATDRTTVFEKMAETARTRHISDDLESWFFSYAIPNHELLPKACLAASPTPQSPFYPY